MTPKLLGLARNPATILFLFAGILILSLEWYMRPHAINGVYFQQWTSEQMVQTVSIEDLRDEPLQQPLVEAWIRQKILGETYQKLGQYEQAEAQLQQALDLYRDHLSL